MLPTFRATRLAPSPTGALHLGHARTFLITWWLARQAGARVYMRMEDLDAGRARPQAVQQAYDDLRWLGMDWDQWPADGGQWSDASGAVVQSRRMGLYQEALERLWNARKIYPCVCTRADIATVVARAASAPHEEEGHPRYPGTCRGKFNGRTIWDAWGAADAIYGRACMRFLAQEGLVGFQDAIAGTQVWDVAREAGDFPVTRFAETADGEVHLPPAYQLACVVDDHDMGIDMVIRGDDLLASTPRQMLLYQALGWEVPRFAHVPLVIGADGKRLAKRHGESRIAQFRGLGVSPQRVVGWVAWRSGQLPGPEEITAAQMVGRFDLANLPRQRVVLGEEDLAWLRGEVRE